ncbi:hypothetical protein NX021_26955 [Cytobacillus firmus]|nr:hypothetical protein [Cytobacillus firmus]
MANQEIVIYLGKEYIIVHKYESGYVEIRNPKNRRIELVHQSELTRLKQS